MFDFFRVFYVSDAPTQMIIPLAVPLPYDTRIYARET